MATGPGLPKNALELLSNPCKVEKPLTAKYWGPAACAVVGFTSVIIGNYLTRRPVFSGNLQYYITHRKGTVPLF